MKKSDAELLNKVINSFKSSWNYRESSYHTTWTNMQKLYNNERVYVGYDGIADTFVPMCYSTIETMVAGTSGDKPMVEFIPTKPEQSTNTEVLNNLYSYYWDIDGWTPKMVQHSRGLFKLGTAVMRAYWNIDHPCIEVIPLRDFFIDPEATFFNYQNARYMGHRFYADIEDLKNDMVVDPKTGELVPKYKNLDKLEENNDTSETTAKEERDQEIGASVSGEAAKGRVEILCYETHDEIVYVGNRSQVIYQNTNYFKERQQFLGIENPTGMFSYIIDAYSPDEAQLYGKSVLEPIAKPQEMLNDLTNQNIDAVSWAIDPEMELDPQYASYLDKMNAATGNIYPFKPGSYSAVKKPLLPANVFNERTNIKNEIREATAIDQIIKGIAMGGDTTATEVKAQVASAGRRFNLLIAMLESGGYYRMAKLVFQMIQLYVTQPTILRVAGEKGVDWETYDPEMFKGDYEPRVKLKATIESEKQTKVRDYKEMFAAMVGNPHINEEALTKFILRKAFSLSFEEAAEIVKSPEQMQQEAQAAQPQPDKTPEEIALQAVGKSYGKGAAPDIEAQLEEMAGLQPSALHEDRMDTNLTDNMAQQQAALGQIYQGVAGPEPGMEQNATGA